MNGLDDNTPLNRELVALKLQLAEAKERLTKRQWATLRAILLIALTADEERSEREVA